LIIQVVRSQLLLPAAHGRGGWTTAWKMNLNEFFSDILGSSHVFFLRFAAVSWAKANHAAPAEAATRREGHN